MIIKSNLRHFSWLDFSLDIGIQRSKCAHAISLFSFGNLSHSVKKYSALSFLPPILCKSARSSLPNKFAKSVCSTNVSSKFSKITLRFFSINVSSFFELLLFSEIKTQTIHTNESFSSNVLS